MKFQFTNRASTHLAAPLSVDGTYLTVAPGTGERFPAATADAPAQITIVSVTGESEIVRCTNRAGDVLDILRGQEGSSVSAFPEGSLIELRLTAEVLNSFLPLGGGQMAGGLEMAGNSINNANLYGSPYIDAVKTTAVFPPDRNFAAAIEMFNGGVLPRINSYSILTTVMLHSAVFLWWGRWDQLPPWLKVCDGTNNTPDLRNRFPLGANHDGDIGEYSGQFDVESTVSGGHNHSDQSESPGSTWEAALSSGNLPGLTAPTINQSKIKIVNNVLLAAQSNQNTPSFDAVTNVSISGGGTYSGSRNHAHGINRDGWHTHWVSIRPPYFKLYYVMFRSMQIN